MRLTLEFLQDEKEKRVSRKEILEMEMIVDVVLEAERLNVPDAALARTSVWKVT